MYQPHPLQPPPTTATLTCSVMEPAAAKTYNEYVPGGMPGSANDPSAAVCTKYVGSCG